MVPFTVETNQTPGRPALLVDLNGVLVHSFRPDLNEDPPYLDPNDYHVSDHDGRIDFVRKDTEMFLFWASQICDVFVWSSMKLHNLDVKLKKCLPVAIKFLSGWLGKSAVRLQTSNFWEGSQFSSRHYKGFLKDTMVNTMKAMHWQ